MGEGGQGTLDGGFIGSGDDPEGVNQEQFLKEQEEIRHFQPPDESTIQTRRRAMQLCYWAVREFPGGHIDKKMLKNASKGMFNSGSGAAYKLAIIWLERKGLHIE